MSITIAYALAISFCLVIILGFAVFFGIDLKFLLKIFRPFSYTYYRLWVYPKVLKKAENKIAYMITHYDGNREEILQLEGSRLSKVELEVLNNKLPDFADAFFDD